MGIKRKMKIYRWLMFCIGCTVLSLASCGHKEADAEASAGKTPQKSAQVQFYIENSGSMHGFVRGGTQFKDVLEHLMVMARDEYGHVGVKFVNSAVVGTGLPEDVSEFCLKLNPNTIRVGKTTSSDINDIFAQVLRRTDRNTISLLFSDCIYSVHGKNATAFLNHEKNLTQKAFMDAMKRHGDDLSLVMLRCKSRFTGYYYDMNDEGHLYDGMRPYFVVIVGPTTLVRDFCNRIPLDGENINGLANKYMVSPRNVALDNTNACILTSDFTNARRIIPLRKSLGIERMDVGNSNEPLYFSVAVDANRLFTDESYLKNTANYTTAPAGLKVVRIDKVAPEGTAYGDCVSAGLENPYYITLQTPNETVEGQIKVNLKYKLPDWVEEASISDDTRKVPSDKTFGIGYMMRGINDAFLSKNPEKSIFKLDFVVNKASHGSSFPIGLIVVLLAVAAIVGISIKIKRR